MPTQEQLSALIGQLRADGRSPDEIIQALSDAFRWSPAQSREVVIRSFQNAGDSSVVIGGNTISFTDPQGVQALPIPEGPLGQIPTETPTPAPPLFQEAFSAPILSPTDAFTRFSATSPFAQVPGAVAGARRGLPQAQAQFALQPLAGFDEFQDFLGGGQRLTGQALDARLGQLGDILRRTPGAAFPEGDLLGAALESRFLDPSGLAFDPSAAFAAFQLPALQGLSGTARRLVSDAFSRFENRFLGQNPLAQGKDVASLFGR